MNQVEVKKNENENVHLHTMAYARCLQVNSLERDASEVLALVRSAKNSFAPVNRIPPEILSLVPDYFGGDDKQLIALTHVCRSWRDTFIFRPSLWTQPDFKNIDKTRAYIQRSQSSPLKLCLGDDKAIDDAYHLIIPHLSRVKSLTVDARALPDVLGHFRCDAPLLETLHIKITFEHDPVLDDALFNGKLSSLRELSLEGVITHLPWKNLTNLQVFELGSAQRHGTTQILDFLESAPLLRTVLLNYPTPGSSDAPPERIVPLHHLNTFAINNGERCPTPLRHIHMPAGAALVTEFDFGGEESPLLDYLPERSSNLRHPSHVTTINLLISPTQKFMLLSGPGGSLRVLATWLDWWHGPSYNLDCGILRSLSPPILSTTERITISYYEYSPPDQVEECPIFQILFFANGLRTLILNECNNLPFILALDPEQNPSNLVLCSDMEELIIYITSLDQFHIERFINMTKNRASRGVKLPLITFVGLDGLALEKAVFRIREQVMHVEYRADDEPPLWDDLPGESGGEGGGIVVSS